MKNSVLLWGTGKRAVSYMEKGYFNENNIVGFVDTFKKNDFFMGYAVYKPEEIVSVMEDIDYIIIVTRYFSDVLGICKYFNIDNAKIVITDAFLEYPFAEYFSRLEKISKELYLIANKAAFRIVNTNEMDAIDLNRKVGNGKYRDREYTLDYFRYRTFEFAAREIVESNIQGAVAEFGVFRGTFASMINEIFNERKLYLFDTFEGFEKKEAEMEIQKGNCDEVFVKGHMDTSVECMLCNLPYPEKSVICKGIFPDSLTEEAVNEKYAFVSIDVDFEESSYQGLKFFYPRLVENGIIFMHDYNTYYLDGVKKAVQKYEEVLGEKLKRLPLADRAGTLVIIK